MATGMVEIPLGLLRAARFVLLPWRAGWASANRAGLLGAPPIGETPHLDPEMLARWREEVTRAKVYLEYGSGASTVAAARVVERIYSVDSDARYLAAVAERAEHGKAADTAIETVYVDIGRTEKWGRPLLEYPLSGRARKWRRYTEAPWELTEARGDLPDFVFVDGRFRVACVLESLLRLGPGSGTTIMLDDFSRRRRAYAAVLDFAEAEPCGRGLLLRPGSPFDADGCRRALRRYQRDPE